MAEITRCAHLVSASIASPSDITLYTPNGHVNSATIPTAGINVVPRSYIDAIRASVSLVGYADTSAAQLTNLIVLNNTITTSDTVVGGVVLSTGIRVLLTADMGIAVGIYTVVGPGILTQTLTVSPGDAVFVQNVNQLYYCIIGRIIIPWAAGAANINIYPKTPQIATILANIAGTFVFNSGVYTLPTLTCSHDNTVLIGYGAVINMAAPLQISANSVRIIGATISGGIIATNCGNLHLRDITIFGGQSCSITGGTVYIDNMSARDAAGAGIILTNVTGGRVVNSTAHDNLVGISLNNTKNISVVACGVYDNKTGIILAGCDSIVIATTLIRDNLTGVDASTATNCTIGGHISANTVGVVSDDASNTLSDSLAVNMTALVGVIGSNVLPPGSIQIYAGASTPYGWLVCDGSAVACTTYANLFAAIGHSFGGDTSSFNVPDLRNMFVRGFDPRAPRAFGTVEADSFGQHTHDVVGAGLAVSATSAQAPSLNTYTNGSMELGIILPITKMAPAGGTETRPVNVNLSYLIKY